MYYLVGTKNADLRLFINKKRCDLQGFGLIFSNAVFIAYKIFRFLKLNAGL
jgi:hypothetical protein